MRVLYLLSLYGDKRVRHPLARSHCSMRDVRLDVRLRVATFGWAKQLGWLVDWTRGSVHHVI